MYQTSILCHKIQFCMQIRLPNPLDMYLEIRYTLCLTYGHGTTKRMIKFLFKRFVRNLVILVYDIFLYILDSVNSFHES